MFPFPRMIQYGNASEVITANFLMRAKSGMVDLAHPTRVISQVGTISYNTTTFLTNQVRSFDFSAATSGTTRYIVLQVADMADLNISKTTGDYTIEYFAYIPGVNGNYWYLSQGAGATSGVKLFNNNMYLQNNAGGGNLVSVSTIPQNAWIHCALVQSGTNIYWYMNGTLKLSATGRWNTNNTPIRIGGYEVVSNSYVDQIRINNTAMYNGSATITVPTYPLS